MINKHMDDSKKAARAGKRIFSDLTTIKAPQDSGITIINKNWHIVADQYMGYKELEYYCIKSDFVEPTCKKFNKWRYYGKLVTYISNNNALEKKVFIKITNDSQ